MASFCTAFFPTSYASLTQLKIRQQAKTKPSNTNINTAVISPNPHNSDVFKTDNLHALFLCSSPSPSSPSTAVASQQFPLEYARNTKDNVRQLLRDAVRHDCPLQGLEMVDAIQRFSLDHHFQGEIRVLLWENYLRLGLKIHHQHYPQADLFAVALIFRLLRQQGYYVPADVFNRFTDGEGNFKQNLSKDIKGLMELYEASQLGVSGEAIIDKARDFSRRVLGAQMPLLDPLQARAVADTLAHPHHTSLPRFASRRFLADHGGAGGWMDELRDLAKLDSSAVQSLHRNEMLQISRWWNELGLSKGLRFARNQPQKWHMWSIVALSDPDLAEERIDLTKPISLIYVIDDIFDVVGTLDELHLFTQAVARWEFSEQLPEYMRKCLVALDAITNEISYKIYQKHGWNAVGSLRKTWADLCQAFMVEAEWFASKRSPSAEEYLRNGVVSSGLHVVMVHIFFLLGQGLIEETVRCVDESSTPFMTSPAAILRLWDDLGSAKDEYQAGHDGSYVEYYMTEHLGCTVASAREHVMQMISDAWKRLNKECLSPTIPFPTPVLKASLNLARMVPMMYDYDDNQSLPLLEEHMKSLFIVHPCP